MKIKTKLTLGVGLLFLLIILLSIMGTTYINALKSDTENILVSNYNTLEYARNMLSGLENDDNEAINTFEINLQKQENNNTEVGEKEATTELRKHFEQYKIDKNDKIIAVSIRNQIFKIMDMNMQAIQRKSKLAKQTAYTAYFWIAFTGTFCFMIAFTLLINLPSYIANPKIGRAHV